MTENFKDYYKILGLTKDANIEEIRKAYRELAKEIHPDKYISKNLTAEELKILETKFIEVTEAYETLKDPVKKAKYDKSYEQYQETKQNRRRTKHTNYESSNFNNSNSKTKTSTNEESIDETFFENLRRTYQELKREERKQGTFTKRHRKINRKYRMARNLNIQGKVFFYTIKGLIHISDEFIVQLEKIKCIKNDTLPKYVLRNRHLLAAGLCTFIIFNTFGNDLVKEETNIPNQNQLVDEDAYQQPTSNYQSISYLTRYHTVEFGDTLSQLAVDSNSEQATIINDNNLESSNIYIGTELKITYKIPEEDLKYYTSQVITEGRSLKDIAELCETDLKTLYNLNEEAIEIIDGAYYLSSETITVPIFRTKEEVNELKEEASYNKKTL